MKGKNVILMNKATVIAAMQKYLDSLMSVGDRIEVTDVELNSGNPFGKMDSDFRLAVTINEPKTITVSGEGKRNVTF